MRQKAPPQSRQTMHCAHSSSQPKGLGGISNTPGHHLKMTGRWHCDSAAIAQAITYSHRLLLLLLHPNDDAAGRYCRGKSITGWTYVDHSSRRALSGCLLRWVAQLPKGKIYLSAEANQCNKLNTTSHCMLV